MLRVDGHTDKRPITGTGGALPVELGPVGGPRHRGGALPGRQGHPADHLVAAGFGEFQPLEEGDTRRMPIAKNRRIELKLTER